MVHTWPTPRDESRLASSEKSLVFTVQHYSSPRATFAEPIERAGKPIRRTADFRINALSILGNERVSAGLLNGVQREKQVGTVPAIVFPMNYRNRKPRLRLALNISAESPAPETGANHKPIPQ